jgi:hypothetical protein
VHPTNCMYFIYAKWWASAPIGLSIRMQAYIRPILRIYRALYIARCVPSVCAYVHGCEKSEHTSGTHPEFTGQDQLTPRLATLLQRLEGYCTASRKAYLHHRLTEKIFRLSTLHESETFALFLVVHEHKRIIILTRKYVLSGTNGHVRVLACT